MRRLLAVSAALAVSPAAFAALMIPDSGAGDRVMLFDDYNGALIDANWLTDAGAVGWFFTTPKEAALVNGQIWVSDQVADAIHRFDLNRNYLGSITQHFDGGALDNLRGFGDDGKGRVYLTISPSATNRRGWVICDYAGNAVGFAANSSSLFDAAPVGDNMLLISNSTNNTVQRYTTDGALVNVFASNIPFGQQVATLDDGSVLSVGSIGDASNEGVWHHNADGSLRLFIPTEGAKAGFGELVPRGAYRLGNGQYLITTSIGVITKNPTTRRSRW
jgi:hypothetical protein